MVRYRKENGLNSKGVKRLRDVFVDFVENSIIRLGITDSSGNVKVEDNISKSFRYKEDMVVMQIDWQVLSSGTEVAGIVLDGKYGRKKVYQGKRIYRINRYGGHGDVVKAIYTARLSYQNGEKKYGESLSGLADYLKNKIKEEVLGWNWFRIIDENDDYYDFIGEVKENMSDYVSFHRKIDGIDSIKEVRIGRDYDGMVEFKEKVDIEKGSYDRLVVSVVEKVEVV